jgi:thioredoxin 1
MNDHILKPQEPRQRSVGEGLRSLTESNFDLVVLAGNGPIAVEFMSYGCAHCRVIEPALLQVAELLKAQEKIYKVNIAVERGLARSFDIEGTPTFVMFLNGEEVGRIAGPDPDVSSVLAAVTAPFA